MGSYRRRCGLTGSCGESGAVNGHRCDPVYQYATDERAGRNAAQLGGRSPTRDVEDQVPYFPPQPNSRTLPYLSWLWRKSGTRADPMKTLMM